MVGIASSQAVGAHGAKAYIARLNGQLLDALSVPKRCVSGASEGELIESIATMHDERPFRAEVSQDCCDGADARAIKDAYELMRGVGRVCHRPQEVQHSAKTEFSADWARVPERAVVMGRKHEADPQLIDTLRDRGGRQVEVDA